MLIGVLPPLPIDRHLNTVYWNTGAFGARANHWLELRFSGADQSLLIGAEVEAFEGGALLGSRQLTTAESYKAGGELMAHFGLGQHQTVEVHVKLRTGDHWFRNLSANAIYLLNLSSDTAARCCQAPIPAAKAIQACLRTERQERAVLQISDKTRQIGGDKANPRIV